MNKRAQFFLIATFIVIALFLSLVLIYNSSSPKDRGSNIDQVANNLKYEGVQIINNGYKFDKSHEQISEDLKKFSSLTSTSFRTYNFYVTLVDDSSSQMQAFNYINGVETSLTSLEKNNGNVTLTLNSLEFSFKLTKGYNFYVIVIDDKQNERYIATA